MPTKGSWISVEETVLDYITESEQSSHKLFKLMQIAFRGMEQLGIDFFYQIKTVKLPVDATKSVKLPSDFGNYSKIGVINSIGEIIPFVNNPNLTLYGANNSDRIAKIKSGAYYSLYDPASSCYYNYWDGLGYGNLYGVPSGGYKGSFRIDENNQVIVLAPDFTYSYIILEYTAVPAQGETWYIPSAFREALVAWISWKDISSASVKRSVIDDKAARRHEFFNERRLAMARYKPFHLMEAYEYNLQAQRLTVKM